MQSKKAELRPGVYVKAHGSMRTNDKKVRQRESTTCVCVCSKRPGHVPVRCSVR